MPQSKPKSIVRDRHWEQTKCDELVGVLDSLDVDKEYDSDDSERAIDSDPKARKVSESKRRTVQVEALASIAAGALPPTRSFRQDIHNLRKKRARDIRDSVPYREDTKAACKNIASYVKRRNLLHNPMLFEATKRSIPLDDVHTGGIESYNRYQGSIRSNLQDVIREKAEELKIGRGDFRNPVIGDIVERSLKRHKISGDPQKEKILDRIRSKRAITDQTITGSAFHHTAFKGNENTRGERYLARFARFCCYFLT
ncbi:MAG: hypothetical protein MK137_09190 [Rickettsiales bacterium]|nr:hypothetical protein [Rickettsiales bacterium]